MKKKMLFLGAALIILCGCVGFLTIGQSLYPDSGWEIALQNIDSGKRDFRLRLPSENGGFMTRSQSSALLAESANGINHIRVDASGRSMDLYMDKNGALLIVNDNGVQMHHQTDICPAELRPNPLIDKLNSLAHCKFSMKSKNTLSGSEYVTISVQEQIPYTEYQIHMTWRGEDYAFAHTVYADGAELMSADAPTEMHPMITKDTRWHLELEQKQMVNTETGETVPFSVVGESRGKALSPNGGQTMKEICNTYFIDLDDTQNVQKITFQSDADESIVYEPVSTDQIEIPQSPQESISMDAQTAQYIIQVMLSFWSI